MKIKRLTLIELLITIMVLGLLAALAIPQFTGVKANADIASFKNDIDVLTKAIDEMTVKEDKLPLGDKVTITDPALLDVIHASGDSANNLYKIDLDQSKKYHSKLKVKTNASDYFIYSMETGKVFYTKGLVDGDGKTLYSMEYIGLTGVKIGSQTLLNGISLPVSEPAQTITGQVPVASNVEVSVNGTSIPVTTEDVVFRGKTNLMAATKYKTFTSEAVLSEGKNIITIKVDSSVTNFNINLGNEASTPVNPTPVIKPVAVISMTPEQGLTTATPITWGYDSSTTASGRTIISVQWEGKQDVYSTEGNYTVRLRIQDSTGVWSDWTEKSILVTPVIKPVAVISMTPEQFLATTTNIVWGYENSTKEVGRTIVNSEWIGKENRYLTSGAYTVKLRVQDSTGVWSDWTEKQILVYGTQLDYWTFFTVDNSTKIVTDGDAIKIITDNKDQHTGGSIVSKEKYVNSGTLTFEYDWTAGATYATAMNHYIDITTENPTRETTYYGMPLGKNLAFTFSNGIGATTHKISNNGIDVPSAINFTIQLNQTYHVKMVYEMDKNQANMYMNDVLVKTYGYDFSQLGSYVRFEIGKGVYSVNGVDTFKNLKITQTN